MFAKTRFATAACVLSLGVACTSQRTTLAEPSVGTPGHADRAVSTPAISCPGGTIRSASEADLYAACEVVEGDLTVSGTSLKSLAALSNLRRIEGCLTLRDNVRLETVRALEGLESVRSLSVTNNRSLQDLVGLEKLRALDELSLKRNGMLTVDGLDGVETVGHLWVSDNRRLISLRGLNGVTHAGSVRIEANPRLAGQPGLLRSLETTEAPIVVKGNAGLSETETAQLRAKGDRAP